MPSLCSFNPRSHEGSDPTRERTSSAPLGFNPRSHEGSDLVAYRLFYDLDTVSIHAPTKGATCCCNFSSIFELVSIHAPTKGATFSSFRITPYSAVSIHAPTKGATDMGLYQESGRRFQSTLPRRERLKRCCHLSFLSASFNPRSHEGSDTGLIFIL